MMCREHARRQPIGASFRQPIGTIRRGFAVRATLLFAFDPQYPRRALGR